MKQLYRNGWTIWHFIAAAGLVLGALWITRDAWRDVALIVSRDEEASHILLVPFVAAWMFWVRRARLRRCQPRFQIIGLIMIIAGWMIYVRGYTEGYAALWHGGALLIVLGAFFSVAGTDLLLRFLPAFAVLIFLVPIPGFIRSEIALPLQKAMAQVSEFVFNDLFGYPITRSGNRLDMNNMPVTVAEACNGLRMVFALFLVSYAFAFGTPFSLLVRTIILAASPILAIFANIVRLIPTVYLFDTSRPGVAMQFHDLAGWVMVLVAFLLLLGVVQVLRWAQIEVSPYKLARG